MSASQSLPRGDAFGVVVHFSAATWATCDLDQEVLASSDTALESDTYDKYDSPYLLCVFVSCTGDTSVKAAQAAAGLRPGLCDRSALRQLSGKEQPSCWLAGDVQLVFHVACSSGNLGLLRELLALTGDRAVNVHANVEEGFRAACRHGHVGAVRELLTLKGNRGVDVHAANEAGFREACGRGHVAVVRELLALTKDRRVDVHAENEAGFRKACHENHIDVVRELLALTGDRRVDVHAGDDEAFRYACSCGHLGVLRELLALTGDRYIDVNAKEDDVFRWACIDGKVTVVRELLALTGDRTVDVHARGDEGFRWACQGGHDQVVYELLRTADFAWECIIKASTPRDLSRLVAVQLPRLPRQVAQQVLLHALHGQCQHEDVKQSSMQLRCVQLSPGCLQRYCAHLAALPAAQCSSLRQALQASAKVHNNTDGDSSCSAMAGACAHLRDAVWRGVAVPYRPVRRQVDEPGLRGALVRAGRGAAVLHRVATRAWVGE